MVFMLFWGMSRCYVNTLWRQRAFYLSNDCKLIQLDLTQVVRSWGSQSAPCRSTISFPCGWFPVQVRPPVAIHFDTKTCLRFSSLIGKYWGVSWRKDSLRGAVSETFFRRFSSCHSKAGHGIKAVTKCTFYLERRGPIPSSNLLVISNSCVCFLHAASTQGTAWEVSTPSADQHFLTPG